MNPGELDHAANVARAVAERVVFVLWMRKRIPDRDGEDAKKIKQEIEGVAHDALLYGQ